MPQILVLADAGADAALAVRAVETSGARLSECTALAHAAARLAEPGGLDAILLELGDGEGVLADELLSRLRELAVARAIPVIVCCAFDAIDRVEARLSGSPAALLVDADELDRVAALTLALQEADATRDRVREIDPVRLRRLSEEVARIARALSNLAAQTPSAARGLAGDPRAQFAENKTGFSAEPADLAAPPLPSAEMVRRVIRTRRLRGSFFDPALFADPAWDILLDLLAARIEGDRVAVSSLCIAAAVPPTTALRWIKTMTEEGLIERHADPDDGRRVYVGLSQAATIALARYFEAAARFEGVAI